MLKNKKVRILFIVMTIVFGITFSLGVFANPNFNIYDFCMGLSSEIPGLVIGLVLIETYIKEKKKKTPPKEDDEE